MKNIKRIAFVCLSIILIGLGIGLNLDTISFAKTRIETKLNEAPIVVEKEETLETSPTKKVTNDYNSKEITLIILTSIITTILVLNLIFTKAGSKTLKESLSPTKNLLYYSTFLILLSTIIPTYTVIKSDKKVLNGNGIVTREDRTSGIIEVNKNRNEKDQKLESSEENKSVVEINKSSKYTGTNLTIEKKAGNSLDKESSKYYGLNSGVIIKDGSEANISNSTIKTNVPYSTGIFIKDPNTVTNLDNVKIETILEESSGISSSNQAQVKGQNLYIKTYGKNSPVLNTISKNSELNINGANVFTEEENSPLISNVGRSELKNIEAILEKSSIATIKGGSHLLIEDSILKTKYNNDLFSPNAFYIYDEIKTAGSDYIPSEFTLKDTNITIDPNSPYFEKAPIFLVSNTKSIINMENVKLHYGSNILFDIRGHLTKDYEEVGSDVVFTSNEQNISGDILVDQFSKIVINLNRTRYKGKINPTNESNSVDVILDTNTYWTLTGDSYINTLMVQRSNRNYLRRQIFTNGHNIYYNVDANEWLNGETITLNGGGKLIPVGNRS